MATQVLKNWYTLLNSVNLSAYIRAVSPNLQMAFEEDTAGDVDSRTYVPTLKNATVSLTFNLELGAGAVEASLWAIFNAGAAVPLVIGPDGSSPGAANPHYSGSVILTAFPPFEGTVGDKGEVTAQFQYTGDVTRAIA